MEGINILTCVYILYSETLDMVKIGYTTGPVSNRLGKLNRSGYGGIKDWQLMKTVKTDYNIPFKVERECHRLLKKIGYRKVIMYAPAQSACNKLEPAVEIFTCTVEQAIRTVNAMANKYNL